MKRIHNTDSEALSLHCSYLQDVGQCFKPTGLWYGLDDSWSEWCISAGESAWVQVYNYQLEVDESRLLLINSLDSLYHFYEHYHEVWLQRAGIADFERINWNAVAQDYAGIEIRDYHALKWSHNLPIGGITWLYGWDCDSGCIWDLSAIQGIESIQAVTTPPG